jgi:hypothetical protein
MARSIWCPTSTCGDGLCASLDGYLVGFIPLLVGVALLAYAFLTPARD